MPLKQYIIIIYVTLCKSRYVIKKFVCLKRHLAALFSSVRILTIRRLENYKVTLFMVYLCKKTFAAQFILNLRRAIDVKAYNTPCANKRKFVLYVITNVI